MIAEVDGDQTSANEILKQIKKWDNALKNNDIDQIIQSYTDDFSLFDVSSQLSGLMQYKAELERLSPYLTKNSYIRRRNIKVHVSGDLAFLYFYTKIENKQIDTLLEMPWCRTTLCLQKKNKKWMVLHQHISIPVNIVTKQAVDLQVKAKLKLVV